MKSNKKSAVSYLFRNLRYLLLPAIVPSVVLAYCAMQGICADFVFELIPDVESASYISISDSTLFSAFKSNWWMFLIGGVTFIFAISLLIARVSTHMRYGTVPKGGSLLSKSIGNLPRVILMTLINFGIAVVMELIITGIIFLLRKAVEPVALWIIVSVMFLLAVIGLAFMLAYTMCALPAVQCDDFPINVALSFSVRIVSTRTKPLLRKFVLLFVLTRAITVVAAVFISNRWIVMTVYALYYLWWICMYPCWSCKVYEDLNDGDRRDLPRYGR